MFQLVKYNFLLITNGSVLLTLAFIFVGYGVALPIIPTFYIVALTLLIALFYDDNRYKVNHFISSLPVSAQAIVKSRYYSFVILSLSLIVYQWLIGGVLSYFMGASYYVYGWKDIIVLACLSLLIAAIAIPIFYLFRSFLLAVGCLFVIVFLTIFYSLFPLVNVLEMDEVIIFNDLDPGFVLMVEKYIPHQSFLALVLASIVIFYISMKISELLFLKKDRSG